MVAKRFRQIGFFLLVLGIWQLVAWLKIWPPFLFPSPFSVFQSLVKGFTDSTFLIAIFISMKRILLGYGLSLLVGIPLGLAIGRIKILEETLGSLTLGLQTLPSICWLPLALLWFGLNERAIIFVVIMGAILSITIATESGVKAVSLVYLRAAQMMGARGVRMYTSVYVPASLPSIVTGMKLGWSFAWRSLMAGELLFVSLGLGHLLQMGRELNDMSQVIAVMVVIITIGLIIDRGFFAYLERGIRQKWGFARA